MAASFYKWLIVGAFNLAHPFFVSVTEVNHNAKDKTLEISCKMFLDDTEKTLKKQLNTTVELVSPKEPKKAQQLLSDYVKKHLQIKIDGKPVTLEFVGYEVEGASIWSYFQVNNITVSKTVAVVNNILFDYKPEQVNIVHVTVKGTRKSTQLVNPNSKASFDFP